MKFKNLFSNCNRRTVVIVFDKDVDLTSWGFVNFLARNIFAAYNGYVFSLVDSSIKDVIEIIATLDKPFVVAYGNAVSPIEEALDKTNNYIRRVFIRPVINEKIVQSLAGNISDYDIENTFTIISADDCKMYEKSDEKGFLTQYRKKHPRFLSISGMYDNEKSSVEALNGLHSIYGYMLQIGHDPYAEPINE